jgi:hypothetical protein
MTPAEIKSEINRIVDLLPEETQIEFLSQLKELQKKHEEEIRYD